MSFMKPTCIHADELNTTTSKSVHSLQGKTAGVRLIKFFRSKWALLPDCFERRNVFNSRCNALIVVDGVPINNSTASGGGGVGKDGR